MVRSQNIVANINTGSSTDFAGNQLSIFVNEDDTILFKFKFEETLSESGPTFKNLAGITAFRVIVREQRILSSNELTFQNDFNNGDDIDFENASIGQITSKVGFGGAAIRAYLQDVITKTMWVEASAITAGGDDMTLFQKEMNLFQQLHDGTSAVPPPVEDFFTIVESNKTYQIKIEGDLVDATTVAQTPMFTVPGGFVFVAEDGDEIGNAQTGAGAAHESQWGTTASPGLLFPADVSDATAPLERNPVDFGVSNALPAGTVIEFGISQANGSTTFLIRPVLKGYLADA